MIVPFVSALFMACTPIDTGDVSGEYQQSEIATQSISEANSEPTEAASVDGNDSTSNAGKYEVFGSWIGTKDYTYGNEGFVAEEKSEKIQPVISGGENGLILKKDVTFIDESGEASKSAKTGQKIYPCEIKQEIIGFNSESGEFLGYLPYEFDEAKLEYCSDGVSESELFENNLHVG